MASRKSLVPILLPTDPVAALEAATKQYVDGGLVPAKVSSLIMHGHSWAAASALASAGTPAFETQGLTGRLAAMLGAHSDNVQNGAMSGSYLSRATGVSGASFAGWAYLSQFVVPSSSPLSGDSSGLAVLSNPAVAEPGAFVIVHGINDASIFGINSGLTDAFAIISNAWKIALRDAISRLRAGALFSASLDSTGAIVWDSALAFSGGSNVASVTINTGPAYRAHTTNGDTDTLTIPTNVPAAFVVAVRYVGTGNAYTTLASASMNNTDVTTAITAGASGVAFATNDIVYDPNNPTELMKITAGGGTTGWTLSRGFNSTTKTTHATGVTFVKYPGGQVNFTGTAATATGSLVCEAQGTALTTVGSQSQIALVKRFACTSADAGKTIIGTIAGLLTGASNSQINFDSAWIEAVDPPLGVVANVPRFQFAFPYSVISPTQWTALNAATATVVAEFDSAVKVADLDTPVHNRGGVLANGALNNTTPGTITGIAITANSTDFTNTTGWVLTDNDEELLVTAISGTYPNYTISALRGFGGTAISAHPSGRELSDRTWFHTDRLHPNAYGHGVFAQKIYEAFASMVPTTYQLAHTGGNFTQDARLPILGVKDNWYLEFANNTAMSATTVFTLNKQWYWPFYVAQECICIGIALVTGTSAGTATAVRAAIYDVDVSRSLPGGLIQELGTSATTATTSVREVAGHKLLTPGWYFASYANQGTTAGTIHTVTNLGFSPNLPHHMVSSVPTATSGTPFFSEQTSPSGSLPATATPQMDSGPCPIPWIHLRAKHYG